MLTYCGKSSLFIQHFRCITADITANKHIPDQEGYLSCDNGKYHLENGDELIEAFIWMDKNKIDVKKHLVKIMPAYRQTSYMIEEKLKSIMGK